MNSWLIHLFQHVMNGSLWKRVCLIIVCWALLYLPGITTLEIDKTDARRIYPALTMLETGNWLVPEYGGELYFRKPPLFNWIIAGSVSLLGINDFSVRIPSRLMILILALCILIFPSSWLGSKERFFSAIILLSYVEVMWVGWEVEIDGCYMAMTGIALLLWLNAYYAEKRGLPLWIPSACILGLTLLLKGPLALLFYYLPILILLWQSNRMKELLSGAHFMSIGIILAIFGVWYLTLSQVTPQSSPHQSTAVWWQEISYRFSMESWMWKRWVRGILGTIFGLFPWLFLLGLLLYEYKKEGKGGGAPLKDPIHSKILPLLVSVGILWILIIAMPGMKTRYFLPAYPIIAWILGCYVSTNKTIPLFWYTLLKKFNFFWTVIICWGLIVFLLARFMPFENLSMLYKTPLLTRYYRAMVELTPWEIIAIWLAFIFHLFFYFGFPKSTTNGRQKIDSFALLCFGSMVSIILGITAFILPFKQQGEESRRFAQQLQQQIPSNFPLWIDLKLSKEPFLFYLRRPYQIVSGPISHLLLSTEKPIYILISESSQQNFQIEKSNSTSFPSITTPMKYRGDHYFLIRPLVSQ